MLSELLLSLLTRKKGSNTENEFTCCCEKEQLLMTLILWLQLCLDDSVVAKQQSHHVCGTNSCSNECLVTQTWNFFFSWPATFWGHKNGITFTDRNIFTHFLSSERLTWYLFESVCLSVKHDTMCITGKSLTPEPLSSPKSQPVSQEETIARKCGWFSVRYFRPETLSGDHTRYIFVNSSQYGIVWANVIFFAIVHCLFAYAFYYVVTTPELRALWIFDYVYGLFGGLGVSAGAHRLWSHKTYHASLPVRIFLMICFTSSGENDIYTWSRDHRLHHKYTETDADPHNSRRGGFFAHVGWLLTRKHPDVLIKGATIDNSDLIHDPVVYYNRKFYIPLYLFFRLYLCIALPVWLLDETASNSFFGRSLYIVSSLRTWNWWYSNF